jgi:fluoride ion exporter CrcB/FEX
MLASKLSLQLVSRIYVTVCHNVAGHVALLFPIVRNVRTQVQTQKVILGLAQGFRSRITTFSNFPLVSYLPKNLLTNFQHWLPHL